MQFYTHFDTESKRLELWSKLAKADTDDALNLIKELQEHERFWAYPGFEVLAQLQHYANGGQQSLFTQLAQNTYKALNSDSFRKQQFEPFKTNLINLDSPSVSQVSDLRHSDRRRGAYKTYFEVLIIHPDPANYELMYRNALSAFKTERDEFVYDILFVSNAEDALAAIITNTSIQTVVHVPGYSAGTSSNNDHYAFLHTPETTAQQITFDPLMGSLKAIRELRPELNHYLISELAPSELYPETRQLFDKVLFHIEPFQDLHLSLLSGIRERYATPFFDALRAYSRKPKGVFHALPLSRGQSIKDSHWITDMLDFYGPNIFLAETSSTQGGMDSLLDPRGAIKQAHDKAAKAFGSEETFFVTNGTSTSNKIVMQANLEPGDIVLISADCHKSIPYAVMLSGAYPVFLETYPLKEYDLYGAVTLERIKEVLLDIKKQGQLHRVKQITLTNSTFDGLIYNTERFMLNILAIKPDIIFHWDEAWFAFSYFSPLYTGRTAMSVAKQLTEQFASESYQEQYANWAELNPGLADLSSSRCTEQELWPKAEDVVLRVYSTQSTHKTLTSFRQGSMLHVFDKRFNRELFLEAYRMHTSTSPNYQIIASLDAGRRQMMLEGYDRVKRAIRLAYNLRTAIMESPTLRPYFRVLGEEELIPENSRNSARPPHTPSAYVGNALEWGDAEFVIDPTRITLDIAGTNMDGSNFRELLINKYDIQVNKTSRKTVLFIVNIGATQETIDYLVGVLHEIAERLESTKDQMVYNTAVYELEQVIDLPQRRVFHPCFAPYSGEKHSCVDMRTAYYAAYDESKVAYVPLDNETLKAVMNDLKLVSAAYVTPYPPGFPVIVPGQIITHDILLYLQKMKIKEIHGYQPELGLKIFNESYLSSLQDQ